MHLVRDLRTLALVMIGAFLQPGWAVESNLVLEGLPIQVEWTDLDGDGRQDLLALMLVTQTEGQMDTTFQDGRLIGYYEDLTVKEKYLATYLWQGDHLQLARRMDLGTQQVLGFSLFANEAPALALWLADGLAVHHWQDNAWFLQATYATPGFLGQQSVQMSEFPFLQASTAGPIWLVPGLGGFYQVPLRGVNDPASQPIYNPYPAHAAEQPGVRDGVHQLTYMVPRPLDVDVDGELDLLIHGGEAATVIPFAGRRASQYAVGEGALADLNGDGLLDRVLTSEVGDIERRKDLPKVKTKVAVHHASGPFVFADEPSVEQDVPGFVLQAEDSGLQLADPFLDLNGDGLLDIAGVAFKFSAFQIAKVVVTGRFTLTFLLQLSIQQSDNTFAPLPGGPFEMKWTFNIRRMKMPTFAQMTGDFNGDGWVDILMNEGKRIEITPLSAAGYETDSMWKVRLPRSLRDAEQVFGRDLDGDGRDELILVKTERRQTRLGVLEAQP